MNTKFIAVLLAIILVLGGLYWFYEMAPQNNLNSNQNLMNQKAYALLGASLNTSTLEINHVPTPPGRSEMLFIVPIAENKYLITKLAWLVVSNPNPTVEEGTTFIMQDGKLSSADTDIKYFPQTGILEGTLPDGANFRFEKNEIITINSQVEFQQVTKLPGWEKAVYTE